MASFSPDITRSQRISPQERKAILDKLDAADAENPAKNRRSMARVPYRTEVVCRIYHPGGSATASVVATRNISAGGVSFLYNGFLHKNTKVELVLVRRHGGEDIVPGIVTHCLHINRSIHQMGVRFNNKIYPKLYLDPSEWTDLSDGPPVDPSTIAGVVLHLDGQEIDRLLLRHNLAATKIDLVSTSTLEEAATAIKAKQIEVVLMDIMIGDMPAPKVIAAIREAGFNGPIAMLTSETAAATLKAATSAGAAAILGKPYDAQKLLGVLGGWLVVGAVQGEAIYSTLPDSLQTRPLIEQYVQRVRVLLRDLRVAINGEDVKSVRAVCQTLRGTGAGFGFASVSAIAKDAVQTLDETFSLSEAMVHLQRLEQTCLRLSASANPSAAAA